MSVGIEIWAIIHNSEMAQTWKIDQVSPTLRVQNILFETYTQWIKAMSKLHLGGKYVQKSNVLHMFMKKNGPKSMVDYSREEKTWYHAKASFMPIFVVFEQWQA